MANVVDYLDFIFDACPISEKKDLINWCKDVMKKETKKEFPPLTDRELEQRMIRIERK